MKKIIIAGLLAFGLASTVHAEVKLANGDQLQPALDDVRISLSDNWNRAMEVAQRRLGLTVSEASNLLTAIKSGTTFSSVEQINAVVTVNAGNNNTGNTGSNGNSGSGTSITKADLDASQKAQNEEQAKVDQKQDSKINDVQTKTDHAFDIAVEGRATANNALQTAYGLVPQVLNNEKAIKDVNETVQKNAENQNIRDQKQDEHITAVEGAAQTANDRATNLEQRADTVEQNVRDTNKQLEVTDSRSINNANRLDGVENKNTEQDNKLTELDKNKVSNVDFKKDQDRQDKALQNESTTRANADKNLQNQITANNVHDALQDVAIGSLQSTKADKADLNKEVQERKNADKVLSDRIDTKVDKSTYATDKETQARIDSEQNNALSTEGTERKDADKVLQANIDKNKADQKVTDSAQDKALVDESTTRANADTVLKQNIDKNKADQVIVDTNQNTRIENVEQNKVDKVQYSSDKKSQMNVDANQDSALSTERTARNNADNALNTRINAQSEVLVNHDERITSNTNRIGAVEDRMSNIEQNSNKRFSDIDKRMGENRKVASAGIAGAGAMANIPQVTQGSRFSVGAGAGGYDGEQAVAVGFSARVTNNVVTKMSVSTNSQSEVLWGAGVGLEW